MMKLKLSCDIDFSQRLHNDSSTQKIVQLTGNHEKLRFYSFSGEMKCDLTFA